VATWRKEGEMKRSAAMFVLLAGVLWGTIGLFVNFLGAKFGFTSMEIVAIRAIFSVVVAIPVILIQDPKLFKINIREIWCFIGTGCLSNVFFNYCYFRTIIETSMSVAAVLLYTAPIFVVALSAVLFKEKITLRKVFATIAVFCGCVLVTGVLESGGGINAKGLLFGLGSGFGYSLYTIFGNYAIEKGYKPLTITFYTFLCASLGALLFVSPTGMAEKMSGSLSYIPFLFMFVIMTTILPFLFYTIGLTHTTPAKAAILATVEPVVATILGTIQLHEHLSLLSALGIAVVVGAVAFLQLPTKKEEK
jgi:drug/metabolite transporter (DMT)-like permease